MDLKKLFDMQTEIENKITNIATVHEDDMGPHNTEELRFLALHIKVSELANLTKCYKYCHVKENIPKDKLTLRYVDAFQYLLSIGNRTGYNILREDALPRIDEDDVIKLFSMVIEQTIQVKKHYFNDNFIQGIHEYSMLFSIIIALGKALNIDFEDVEEHLHKARLTFLTLKFEDINL